MSKIVPAKSPLISRSELIGLLTRKHPEFFATWTGIFFVGVRGYYTKSFGDPLKNDVGVYDDAIFVFGNQYFAFNGNTDPSRLKPNVARLKPGLYHSYKFGLHKGKYLALCQRGAPVTVQRTDANGREREETGMFGINIHRGSYTTTGSEGCQTIWPDQWPAFIELAQCEAKRHYGPGWKTRVYPYILIEI